MHVLGPYVNVPWLATKGYSCRFEHCLCDEDFMRYLKCFLDKTSNIAGAVCTAVLHLQMCFALADPLGLAQSCHRFSLMRGMLARFQLRLKHGHRMVKKNPKFKRETAR